MFGSVGASFRGVRRVLVGGRRRPQAAYGGGGHVRLTCGGGETMGLAEQRAARRHPTDDATRSRRPHCGDVNAAGRATAPEVVPPLNCSAPFVLSRRHRVWFFLVLRTGYGKKAS